MFSPFRPTLLLQNLAPSYAYQIQVPVNPLYIMAHTLLKITRTFVYGLIVISWHMHIRVLQQLLHSLVFRDAVVLHPANNQR